MAKATKIDFHTYMLNLCKKVLNDNIAIDDEAKLMINNILKEERLDIACEYELGIDYLIDFIMYYEDIEYPGIGEDLISYVLNFNR